MSELTKEEFNEKFNKLYTFLETKVALKDDIQDLEDKIPSKELINKLYTVTDALAKEVNNYRTEQSATSHRIEKTEVWIKKASQTVGIHFEQ